MAVTSGVQPHCNPTCCRSRCILPTHRGCHSHIWPCRSRRRQILGLWFQLPYSGKFLNGVNFHLFCMKNFNVGDLTASNFKRVILMRGSSKWGDGIVLVFPAFGRPSRPQWTMSACHPLTLQR